MDLHEPPPVALPDDLPVIERSAVRLVVLDSAENVLLLHTQDQDNPDLGSGGSCPAAGSIRGRHTWTRRFGSCAKRPGSWSSPPG